MTTEQRATQRKNLALFREARRLYDVATDEALPRHVRRVLYHSRPEDTGALVRLLRDANRRAGK